MKRLLNLSLRLGAVAGVVLGVVSLIPVINCINCLTFVLIGAGLIFYLKRYSLVGMLSLQDSALLGAVAGFTAMIAASVVFCPIDYTINHLFNPIARSNFNLASFFLITGYNLIAVSMIVFFVALLSALFNAFSALAAAYIYEKIEANNVDDQEHIIIEQ